MEILEHNNFIIIDTEGIGMNPNELIRVLSSFDESLSIKVMDYEFWFDSSDEYKMVTSELWNIDELITFLNQLGINTYDTIYGFFKLVKLSLPLPNLSGLGISRKIEKSNTIPKELKNYVLKRDNNTCQVCGKKVTKDTMSIDHIIPKSLGGSSFDCNNLQVLCKSYNSLKRSRIISNDELRREL